MNRYKVTIRTDKTFIVEAKITRGAELAAREAADDKCIDALVQRSVIKVVNLTGDPISLLEQLAYRLEATAFQNEHNVCKYCGGSRTAHALDCIIDLARHYIKEHREKNK